MKQQNNQRPPDNSTTLAMLFGVSAFIGTAYGMNQHHFTLQTIIIAAAVPATLLGIGGGVLGAKIDDINRTAAAARAERMSAKLAERQEKKAARKQVVVTTASLVEAYGDKPAKEKFPLWIVVSIAVEIAAAILFVLWFLWDRYGQ